MTHPADQQILKAKDLYELLSKCVPAHFSKFDKLKILYRPYLTPFSELLYLIPPKSSVFEIGFGHGAFLNLVSQIKDPHKLGGVEIQQKLVDNANDLLAATINNKATFKNQIFLSEYDGINLPDLQEFDFVFLIDVIHHMPKSNFDYFFSQIKRKMRPGATLILKDIDASKTFLVLFNKLHDLIVSKEVGNEITKENAKIKLTDAGFTFRSYSYKRMLWYPHYTIIAQA